MATVPPAWVELEVLVGAALVSMDSVGSRKALEELAIFPDASLAVVQFVEAIFPDYRILAAGSNGTVGFAALVGLGVFVGVAGVFGVPMVLEALVGLTVVPGASVELGVFVGVATVPGVSLVLEALVGLTVVLGVFVQVAWIS